MDQQDYINDLGLNITNLITQYHDKLPDYEIGHQLITCAVSMMLYCAPNELVGVKTILACVENGIAMYEKDHS